MNNTETLVRFVVATDNAIPHPRYRSFAEHAAVIRPGTKQSRHSLDDPPEAAASLISLHNCFV